VVSLPNQTPTTTSVILQSFIVYVWPPAGLATTYIIIMPWKTHQWKKKNSGPSQEAGVNKVSVRRTSVVKPQGIDFGCNTTSPRNTHQWILCILIIGCKGKLLMPREWNSIYGSMACRSHTYKLGTAYLNAVSKASILYKGFLEVAMASHVVV
jgi:hypothetical protein